MTLNKRKNIIVSKLPKDIIKYLNELETMTKKVEKNDVFEYPATFESKESGLDYIKTNMENIEAKESDVESIIGIIPFMPNHNDTLKFEAKKLSKYQKAIDKLLQTEASLTNIQKENLQKLKTEKKVKTCDVCHSTINVAYLTSTLCPVCKSELTSAEQILQIEKKLQLIKKQQGIIKEIEEKNPTKYIISIPFQYQKQSAI